MLRCRRRCKRGTENGIFFFFSFNTGGRIHVKKKEITSEAGLGGGGGGCVVLDTDHGMRPAETLASQRGIRSLGTGQAAMLVGSEGMLH